MSWIITGALLWVVGKIIKSNIVSQIGMALVVLGLILWGLGMIGISLALPFGL
jgi:hypothetical protein